MRILVTGATGFIGRHIVNKLLELNYDVVACVRSGRSVPEAWHNIELIEVDFARDDRVSDWLERLKDVDVVINAVGIIKESAGQSFEAVHIKTPCALFEACAIAGVQKVIQISALGADADATSQYHLSKRAADDYLASQSYSWTILRPSIVYGAGAQSMALFKAISSLPFSPLIGDGAQQIQPIHIDDLVRIVVASIETDEGLNACIDLVGPEPISIEKMYTQLRRWLGLGRPRLLRVPYRLSLALSHLGGFVGGAPVTPETVQMLQRGNTADPGPLAERFGVTPKSFQAALDETPAQQADRWHAQLYFLGPLLRYALAFLWLATGLVSAFGYPPEKSFALLAQLGVTKTWAPLLLYGASVLDVFLGLALLLRYRIVPLVYFQVSMIVAYTALVAVSQPTQLLHPYGAILKNIPLIPATLAMLVLERSK